MTAYHELSRGTLDSTVVHPREVFKTALLANAAAVIVAHNHPSGDPSPSADDIALTRRLTQAGNIIGIPVLDHLVIGVRSHFSLREAGLL
jgi:DNA repair protein RadC